MTMIHENPVSGRTFEVAWRDFERIEQLQPNVLAAWNYDEAPDPWGNARDCELSVQSGALTVRRTGNDPFFSTPAQAPEGGLALVLRYRTQESFPIEYFWSDGQGGFGESRVLRCEVPASAERWSEITLPFSCQGALSAVRLDPNTKREHPLEIDSIVLRRVLAAEYVTLLTPLVIDPELKRLTENIDANPDAAEAYEARAAFLTRVGRWREAGEDFARAAELRPDDRFPWFRAVTCLALAGDEEAYGEQCRAMVKQFRGNPLPEIADSICKGCLLRPGAIELSELPATTLRQSLARPDLNAGYLPWFHACCALISYREGKPEEAIVWTEKTPSLTGYPGALALVIRAMAEHRLGQADKARKTLTEAEALIPRELRTLGAADYQAPLPVSRGIVAHDWLAPEALRREAEALIPLQAPAAQ